MYDRAGDRSSFQKKSTTPADICPNTYYLPELFELSLENYAPFLALASARPGMAAKSSKDMPGPDHYYPQYRGRRIKGGTSLTYTDIRFKYMIEDLPGPGDYEIPAAEKPICEPCGKKSCKRGKLHVGRVPYDLRGKGPSVPSKNDRNGFTRTPYGTVVKIPPDDHDETLGPAFYHPKETNFNTERYKGNHFGMMRGQRTTFLGNQGPGPGDYDIVTDKSLTPLQAYTEKLKFWKRKFSRQPRLAELVEINTLKENLPGPGKYNPPPLSGFDVPVVKEKFHNVGFSIGAKRFKPLRPSDTPAPCDTVDPRTAMDGLKKPGSVIYTGFLKLSPRFEKEKLEVTPGPASYTLEGISEEIQRKIPPLHIRALSAFNSSKEREIDFTCKDIKTYPGPGYYEIKDREHPTRPRNAVFRSVVPREGRPPEPNAPPPCTYNPTIALRKIQGKNSHHVAIRGKEYGMPLYMSHKRFGRITDAKNTLPDQLNPGPARYDTRSNKLDTKGISFTTAGRKVFKGDDVPGPGTYTIHPLYDASVLKGTFNCTLGNPIPRRETNTRPWQLQVKARKKLRCFHHPSQEYLIWL